jgi:hypothetical protein
VPQVRHVWVHDGVLVMPKVDSSMMTFVDYDKPARELLILFTSGKAYTYFEVPQKIYRGLMQADSKGRYFLDCIEGQYAHTQARGRRRA